MVVASVQRIWRPRDQSFDTLNFEVESVDNFLASDCSDSLGKTPQDISSFVSEMPEPSPAFVKKWVSGDVPSGEQADTTDLENSCGSMPDAVLKWLESRSSSLTSEGSSLRTSVQDSAIETRRILDSESCSSRDEDGVSTTSIDAEIAQGTIEVAVLEEQTDPSEHHVTIIGSTRVISCADSSAQSLPEIVASWSGGTSS